HDQGAGQPAGQGPDQDGIRRQDTQGPSQSQGQEKQKPQAGPQEPHGDQTRIAGRTGKGQCADGNEQAIPAKAHSFQPIPLHHSQIQIGEGKQQPTSNGKVIRHLLAALQAQQIDEQGQQPHQQVKGGQVPTFNTSSQTHAIHNQHSPNKEKRNTQHGISLQNKVTIPAWLASDLADAA